MVWDMAQKYQDATIDLIGRGLCTSPLPLWADPIDKLAQSSLSDAGVNDVEFSSYAFVVEILSLCGALIGCFKPTKTHTQQKNKLTN